MLNDTQVDHNTCAATGCPGLASMTRGTNGESPWYCPTHFAAERNDWMRVTAELNRLRWLVGIVRALRAGVALTDDMKRSFTLAQRSDLARKESEARTTWMIRLEGVLAQSCRDIDMVDRMERAEVSRAAP